MPVGRRHRDHWDLGSRQIVPVRALDFVSDSVPDGPDTG